MKLRRFPTAAALLTAASITAAAPPSVAAAGEDSSAGTILTISVFGNNRTERSLILRKFGLHPGDGFSETAIDRGLRAIETLSGIASAQYRIVRNEGENGVNVIIVVTEAGTSSITPLLQRTITNEIAFGLAYDEKNFLGADEKIHASALFRGATILEWSWLKPYLLGAPLITVGASVRYRFFQYVYPDLERLLLDDDLSWLEVSASVCLHPAEFLSISLSPGVDRIRLADSMLVGQGEPGVAPTPSGTFSTLETSLAVDLLDRDFYPRSGARISAGRKDWGLFQEGAGMKNFLYRFRGSFFLDLGRALLSLDSWGTFVHGRTPITLIQHAGGEESIRGYDFGVLSGSNCLVGRTEVRIPLNFDDLDDLGNPMVLVDFHLFLDGGACWSKPEELGADILHSGFGCGMNFIPVRERLIEVGYAWRRQTSGMWYFDVGAMF